MNIPKSLIILPEDIAAATDSYANCVVGVAARRQISPDCQVHGYGFVIDGSYYAGSTAYLMMGDTPGLEIQIRNWIDNRTFLAGEYPIEWKRYQK